MDLAGTATAAVLLRRAGQGQGAGNSPPQSFMCRVSSHRSPRRADDLAEPLAPNIQPQGQPNILPHGQPDRVHDR